MTFLLKVILFFIILYWTFKIVSKWLLIRLLKSHPLFKQLYDLKQQQQQQQQQYQQQTDYDSYKSQSGDVEINVKKEGKKKEGKKKEGYSDGEYIDYEEV